MEFSIFLFRHGETDWNVQQRFQGHLDIPLNDRGREQAREIAKILAEHQIEAVLSSDLARAVETGEIVAQLLNVPIFKDPRLREAHLGSAQGLTRAEIEDKFGKELVARWKSSDITDADISYPNGETGAAVLERAMEALAEFIVESGFRRFGVATHGGVIRRVIHRILPPNSAPVLIPNGIIYSLRYDSGTAEFSLENSYGSVKP